jgi:hypothetical protein
MNPIVKAISDIKLSIPPEVLKIAFYELNNNLNTLISLDEKILSKILRPKVLVDCNLMGGISEHIDISKCNVFDIGNQEFLIDVPKTLTNKASILSIYSISNNAFTTRANFGTIRNVNSLDKVTDQLSNSIGMGEELIQTARCEVVGENKILVREPSAPLLNGTMYVNIENNPNMSNLKPPYYHYFSKLCLLATQAYIYNESIIKIEKGYLYSGHELGKVKETVESYSDKILEYDEYLLNTMRKVLFQNDTKTIERHIQLMVGGYN